uniref:Dimer_Tnp_hAT domain-containing protein n=1 Tax=Steinernema glaseri TaxID=37863 RepID=A0A1I7ZK62_9BILA
MTRKELRVWPISVKANKRSFVFCDASRPSRLYSLPNLLARPELPADRFLQNRTPEKARNGSETFATAVVASYPLGKAKRMFNKLAIEIIIRKKCGLFSSRRDTSGLIHRSPYWWKYFNRYRLTPQKSRECFLSLTS